MALRAAEAGDLEELARAVEARGVAIASGEMPTAEILAAGERVRAAAETLRQEIWLDSARLGRIREFLHAPECYS